jgi:hypothetical protein
MKLIHISILILANIVLVSSTDASIEGKTFIRNSGTSKDRGIAVAWIYQLFNIKSPLSVRIYPKPIYPFEK